MYSRYTTFVRFVYIHILKIYIVFSPRVCFTSSFPLLHLLKRNIFSGVEFVIFRDCTFCILSNKYLSKLKTPILFSFVFF